MLEVPYRDRVIIGRQWNYKLQVCVCVCVWRQYNLTVDLQPVRIIYSGTSIIRTSIIRMLGLSERQIRRACAKFQWLVAAF